MMVRALLAVRPRVEVNEEAVVLVPLLVLIHSRSGRSGVARSEFETVQKHVINFAHTLAGSEQFVRVVNRSNVGRHSTASRGSQKGQ